MKARMKCRRCGTTMEWPLDDATEFLIRCDCGQVHHAMPPKKLNLLDSIMEKWDQHVKGQR